MKKILTFLFLVCGLTESHAAGNHHHSKMMHGHHQHDEVNMPGLQGKDTTPIEVKDLKNIFRNYEKITRTAKNLENGIETVTISKDKIIRQSVINHVGMMVTRFEQGKNPEVIIQSPTLTELFKYYEKVNTEIELVDNGIKVIQTSNDPKVVQLLQKHAAEINDMVERGMQSVHERMMKSKN